METQTIQPQEQEVDYALHVILRAANAVLVQLTRHASSIKIRGIRNYFFDRSELSFAQRRVLAKWIHANAKSPNYGEEILQTIKTIGLTRTEINQTKG
jgi:hypothetical protein